MQCVIVEYYMSCYERCVCCSGVIEPPNHPGGIALIQRENVKKKTKMMKNFKKTTPFYIGYGNPHFINETFAITRQTGDFNVCHESIPRKTVEENGMEFTIGELKVSNCILLSQRNEISASTKQGLEVEDTQ